MGSGMIGSCGLLLCRFIWLRRNCSFWKLYLDLNWWCSTWDVWGTPKTIFSLHHHPQNHITINVCIAGTSLLPSSHPLSKHNDGSQDYPKSLVVFLIAQHRWYESNPNAEISDNIARSLLSLICRPVTLPPDGIKVKRNKQRNSDTSDYGGAIARCRLAKIDYTKNSA